MADTIELCIAQLDQSDTSQQATAAEQLARMGEDAQPAIVALVRRCESQNEDVLNWCTAALEEIGPPTDEQLDALIQLARDENPDVAYWAVTLLGRAGEAASHAVPVLVEIVADESSPQLQHKAIWALGRLGRNSDDAVVALKTAIESGDAPLARKAKDVLERIQAL